MNGAKRGTSRNFHRLHSVLPATARWAAEDELGGGNAPAPFVVGSEGIPVITDVGDHMLDTVAMRRGEPVELETSGRVVVWAAAW